MPMPIGSLLHIEYHLRNTPDDLPEHEKQRLIALTAINHLGSLGRILAHLSTAKPLSPQNPAPAKIKDELEEFDCGLFVLGELQACIADTAYMAVEEMFSLLNEPPAEAEEVSHA